MSTLISFVDFCNAARPLLEGKTFRVDPVFPYKASNEIAQVTICSRRTTSTMWSSACWNIEVSLDAEGDIEVYHVNRGPRVYLKAYCDAELWASMSRMISPIHLSAYFQKLTSAEKLEFQLVMVLPGDNQASTLPAEVMEQLAQEASCPHSKRVIDAAMYVHPDLLLLLSRTGRSMAAIEWSRICFKVRNVAAREDLAVCRACREIFDKTADMLVAERARGSASTS